MGSTHCRCRNTAEAIAHGVQQVLILLQQTIKFINDDATSKHGSLRVGSIYTTESGEWKLGGFEVLSNVKDSESALDVGDLLSGGRKREC